MDSELPKQGEGYRASWIRDGVALDMDITGYGDELSVTSDHDGEAVRVALHANDAEAIRLSIKEARTLARMLHRICNSAPA